MTFAAHLWVFFGLVFGIILLPGLDMACVLACTLGGGRRAGSGGGFARAVAEKRQPALSAPRSTFYRLPRLFSNTFSRTFSKVGYPFDVTSKIES